MRHLVMRRPNLDDLPPMPELPPGYTLRTYRESDMEPLAALMRDAFKDKQWTPAKLREALVDAPDVHRIFVIDYAGKPVASASVRLLPERFPDSGYVHWVAVDPAHQGQRLGYVVTLATLYEFASMGCKDAVLETDDHRLAAIKTYQNLGFVPEHHHESHLERWAVIADMLAAANFVLIFALLLFAVSRVSAQAKSLPQRPTATHLLVVENTRSADSLAIAGYYVRKRHVPGAHLCRIACPTTEECTMVEYKQQMEAPIKRFVREGRLAIDYIVLTKGMPIKTKEGPAGGFCTDSLLATMDWSLLTGRSPNPYFAKSDRFTHAKYNLYLVTRLIGYSRADCLKLIDNAVAARPARGPFLIHTGPGHESGGYKSVNDGMREAHAVLTRKGLQSILDTNDAFTGGYTHLMGYFSWGSNDKRYDKKAYNSLRFVPGAIAETAVSTSARTFDNPNAPGQSLIGDIVAQGVTGCKGYVSEPFADSIAHADILFDRYTSGFTLAESFYAASPYIYWKDIVIGDPLCAPYASPSR
jgi:uncharacterized protein (TIGR03790 family)